MSKIIVDENDKHIFIDDNKTIDLAQLKTYNSSVRAAHMFLKINHHLMHMTWFGILVLKDTFNLTEKGDLRFISNNKAFYIKPLLKINLRKLGFKFILYSSAFKYDSFLNSEIHNNVFLTFEDENGFGFYKRIKYNFLYKDKSKFKSSGIKMFKANKTSLYVRQSSNNSVIITTRLTNTTDFKREQHKIMFAKFISFFTKKNIIVMYEKDGKNFEESASVLFDRLLLLGYKNIRYILSKENKEYSKLKAKYGPYIVEKHSLDNYIYLLNAKTFIGTEAPAHAVDLRISNRFIEKKLADKDYKFIFLQHGVMYMVSLSSKSRRGFKKGGGIMPINTKIVVSSKEEAMHFIEHGNYEVNDFYVSGLPKYDMNTKNKNADKIVIMPTWRPWEYNEVRVNAKDSGYYKMLLEIKSCISKEYKDKIIVLPHPLFKDLAKDFNEVNDKSHDEILRECALLITDYSSIAFDAFHRGSNVIFWWKEKDECMEKYKGKLMLDEENIFGDICKSKAQLKKAIENNYMTKQNKKYINNFNKIVEFNDGKNTDRLIEMLVKDNILK